MTNNLIKISLIVASLASPIAHAQWITNTEDDLFSGGKKAMMLGSLTSSSGAIIFDCTKEKLTASYVEEDKSSDEVPNLSTDLIIKVDGNAATKLDASLSRRNAQSLQIKSEDSENITQLLKQLQGAKSKVLVGVQTKDGGNQSSFSADVSGSTAAVNSFIKACEITL
ncbi:hypothetical protein I5485_13190 [Citrobacter farmeri]|uniref:hypothetical protein n=1 Tax=Citrobacter farmeri TaxID=67824 RepID=UPI001905CF2E|nr:hypothetical protein [Citrobacter farmeri]MBJ9163384.1 hypothetical protein [Citrobacter farmeri]